MVRFVLEDTNESLQPSHRFLKLPLSLLPGLAVLLSGCAAYSPPRVWGESIHRNIVFASPGGRDLRLDLYLPPKSARPAPVVLWVFGGGWKLGSRGYHLNVRDLTKHGIAIAAMDYRLSDEAKYPAQLQDCQAALHWLQANADQYGLDPKRIAAAGESSGGHLAALLGTIEGREKIRAVFALYPVTDLVAIGRQYAHGNPSDIERLLGGPIEEKLDLARAGSPVNHVSPDSPPFLIIHGAKDTLVLPDQSQQLHNRLQAAGVESRLIFLPDKGHWFTLSPAQRDTVAKFFQSHFAD